MSNVGKLGATLTLDQSGFAAGMEKSARSTEQFSTRATTATRTNGEFTGSSNKATRGLLELSRGAEDAASQFGTMGFAGAIRGASNNISQFGAIMSPMTGAIFGVAAAIGSVLVSSLEKAAKAAKDANKELNSLFNRNTDIFKSAGMRGVDTFEKTIRDQRKIDDLRKKGKGKEVAEIEKKAQQEVEIQGEVIKQVEAERRRFLQNTFDRLDAGSKASVVSSIDIPKGQLNSTDMKRSVSDLFREGKITQKQMEAGLRVGLQFGTGKDSEDRKKKLLDDLDDFDKRKQKAVSAQNVASQRRANAQTARRQMKDAADEFVNKTFGVAGEEFKVKVPFKPGLGAGLQGKDEMKTVRNLTPGPLFNFLTNPFRGFGGKEVERMGFKDSPFERAQREFKDMVPVTGLTKGQEEQRDARILGLRRRIASADRETNFGGGSLSGNKDRVSIARQAAASLRKAEDPTQVELLKIAQEELMIMKQQLKELEKQKGVGTIKIP